LVLGSIHWREAWKYGARAYRYCQHDAGHALAALSYAAAALGWRTRLLTAPGDGDLYRFLGLQREDDFAEAEPESPDLALAIGPDPDRLDISTLLDLPKGSTWQGRANRLSSSRRDWPQIDQAARNCRKPPSLPLLWTPPQPPPAPAAGRSDLRAADLFRGRRSAVAFDGQTHIPAGSLFAILDNLLPRPGVAPWDSLPWAPRLHPLLFIHRVTGLAPGLYALPRSPGAGERLRTRLAQFRWERPPGCPDHLPLFLLQEGDFTGLAGFLSCHQAIAADSALALAMLADFADSLAEEGPWAYRWLFWEAGMLGQVLYLEAEAAGLRGTGIGCYFDDALHQLLGLDGDEWQDLYHFTLGKPLEDPRIGTEPPYAHLRR
jgi:nitroreductase